MTDAALDPKRLMSIDGATFALSPDEDIDELQHRIQAAVERPQFVRITTAGGTELRVFVNADRRMSISVIPPGVAPGVLATVETDAFVDFEL